MNPLKFLYIQFNLPLQPWQIPQFRGALSEWIITHKSEILSVEEQDYFHNHNNQQSSNDKAKFHYRYPLIQYRSIRGKAAICVLNEAIPTLQKVLIDLQPPFRIQGETHALKWEDMQMREHTLKMTDRPQTYRLRNWVALNKERMEDWEQIRGLRPRVTVLEKALAGQLIAFAIGMDWQIPKRFDPQLLDLKNWKQVRYHKIHLNAFDVVFDVPLLLPGGIGIGKATSHGFGVLQKWRFNS